MMGSVLVLHVQHLLLLKTCTLRSFPGLGISEFLVSEMLVFAPVGQCDVCFLQPLDSVLHPLDSVLHLLDCVILVFTSIWYSSLFINTYFYFMLIKFYTIKDDLTTIKNFLKNEKVPKNFNKFNNNSKKFNKNCKKIFDKYDKYDSNKFCTFTYFLCSRTLWYIWVVFIFILHDFWYISREHNGSILVESHVLSIAYIIKNNVVRINFDACTNKLIFWTTDLQMFWQW